MALEKWVILPGESRVIDVELVRKLKVGLIGGQIDIIGHDEDSARIEVHSVTGKDLKISIDGDVLEIDHPQLGWENFLDVFKSFGQNSAKAEISVLVPRRVALTFGMVSANALVSGLTTSARLSTVNGELQVEGITGDLDLNSVSGEMSVQSHTGAINAHTVSGDITASGNISRFSSDGVSGDVFVDAQGHCDRISTNTVSGHLTARLSADVGTRYVVNTVSGKLQLDSSVIKGTRGRGFRSTTEGDGNFYTDVVANSVSGNVTVIRRADTSSASTDDAFSTEGMA
ncbi:hypothetical protein D9V29_02370 [Mycetocola manganoxydans]|uniref:DUF4097 domain-containing protein n=1 Tax=Mycetocola manganoxydans TaxID=699879 RepID=A0A3L6ZYH5_9MICO|nr:DUF4097 family beta strand repeat-containing protein [Mycetocola manganoxydans]RLP72874.1 hypothetical protein D9V29_02370 [Mycetocola manganoxydans]GHD45200.1 hypothetical protein GCM10008097_14190 [Mycetocola manganoxydans]